jgi:VanZ family protein
MKIEKLIKELLEQAVKYKSINKLCLSIEKTSSYKKLLLVLNNSTSKQKHINAIKNHIDAFKENQDDIAMACMIFVLSKHEGIDMRVDPKIFPMSFEIIVSCRLQNMGDKNV